MQMRQLTRLLSLCAILTMSACDGHEAQPVNNSNQANTAGARTSIAHAPPAGNPSDASIASAHGGPAAAAPASEADRALLNTATLDAKIAGALAKGKAPNASDADKKALAAAYLERGNAYRDAGNPSLYKFALADYNSVLLYDPSNAEAQAKKDEIVGIYRSMGRPIPQVSNEK